MASTAARSSASKNIDAQYAPEGVSRRVYPSGPVQSVMSNLSAGVRSGLSYSGVGSIGDLQRDAVFISVSGHGLKETYTISDGDS